MESAMVDIALVDVTIPSFSQMQDGSGKSYTSYRIEYEDHGASQESGSATHRYSAFLLLDRQLRRLLHKGIKLPTLPKKRVFGHTDGAVLEYRRSKLEMYLRMLLHTPDVCKNAARTMAACNPNTARPQCSLKAARAKPRMQAECTCSRDAAQTQAEYKSNAA